MNQPFKISHFAPLAALLLLPLMATAVPSFSGDLEGDEFFSNGVLLTGVDLPEDQTLASGSSTIALAGSGTLTVGNQTGGGFPRVTVLGGTTITSARNFDETVINKSWWDGQFTSPGSTRIPNQYDIEYSSLGSTRNELQVSTAYAWGLANETFSFTTPARVVFPVDEVNGQKLLVAHGDGAGNWSIDSVNDFCIAEDGLCYLELDSMNEIALVKELYEVCPQASISNGVMGNAPTCIVSCNRGYTLNSQTNNCEAPAADDFAEFDEDGEFAEEGFQESAYQEEDPGPAYEFPQGYFKYQGSAEQKFRKLDETGLEGEELARAKHLNTGYLSRNPRSVEEQVKKEVADTSTQDDDNFMNYLLQMRNYFAQNGEDNSNVFSAQTAADTDGGSESELITDNTDEEAESFHSGAPLLPSTGSEMFVAIAIIGFLMMLFGARRRN